MVNGIERLRRLLPRPEQRLRTRALLTKRGRATIVLDEVDQQLLGVRTQPRETFIDPGLRALALRRINISKMEGRRKR